MPESDVEVIELLLRCPECGADKWKLNASMKPEIYDCQVCRLIYNRRVSFSLPYLRGYDRGIKESKP